MAIVSRFRGVVIAVAALVAAVGTALMARENRTVEQDRAGIERLHQQDMVATLSDKADELAKLWDNDAVRLAPVMNFTENLVSAAPVAHPCE